MVGDRIKQLRKTDKITQEKLAQILNVSTNTIGHYEHGRRTPSVEGFNKLADFFNVSVDWIMGRTDKLPTKPTERPTDKILSTRIRTIRELKGISMQDIADTMDISLSEYKAVEAGQVPDIDQLISYAKYVDVSLDYLVGNTDNPRPMSASDDVAISDGMYEKFQQAAIANRDILTLDEMLDAVKDPKQAKLLKTIGVKFKALEKGQKDKLSMRDILDIVEDIYEQYKDQVDI